MTKAGKLEREFDSWKKDIENRLAALEAASKKTVKSIPTNKKNAEKDIVIETKENDIVASEA